MADTAIFEGLSVGDRFKGQTIGLIYHFDANRYIIYHTKENPKVLEWNYNLDEKNIKVNFLKFRPNFASVNSLLARSPNADKYMGTLASALATCFDRSAVDAVRELGNLESELKKERDIILKGKALYLGLCLVCVSVLSIISVIMQAMKDGGFWDAKLFLEYWKIGMFGTFGAFFSIVYKINREEYHFENDRQLMILQAITRIFIGMLASIIAYSLIKSQLLLSFINHLDAESSASTIYIYYSLAVVAGFSENFIPDILYKIERKSKTGK